MYVKVRIKTAIPCHPTITMKVDLPADIRDLETDTITDVVSDYLDENRIQYKWFRVLMTTLTNDIE